jgi:hypothetical protein
VTSARRPDQPDAFRADPQELRWLLLGWFTWADYPGGNARASLGPAPASGGRRNSLAPTMRALHDGRVSHAGEAVDAATAAGTELIDNIAV